MVKLVLVVLVLMHVEGRSWVRDGCIGAFIMIFEFHL